MFLNSVTLDQNKLWWLKEALFCVKDDYECRSPFKHQSCVQNTGFYFIFSLKKKPNNISIILVRILGFLAIQWIWFIKIIHIQPDHSNILTPLIGNRNTVFSSTLGLYFSCFYIQKTMVLKVSCLYQLVPSPSGVFLPLLIQSV